jgi:putative transposase
MPRKGRSNEEIVHALGQVDAGEKVTEVCRRLGVSEQTFYRWKKQFAGLGVQELPELRSLRDENRKLKQVVADLTLDRHPLQEIVRKSSEASRTLHPGGMGADDLSSEPTPGGEADWCAHDDEVPADPRPARRLTPTAPRARGGAGTVRLSAIDGVVATRGLAREREADLSAVWTRGADRPHEATPKTGQSCPRAAPAADASEWALEHGLRKGAPGRRSVVPDTDGARPLHARVVGARRGSITDRREGGGDAHRRAASATRAAGDHEQRPGLPANSTHWVHKAHKTISPGDSTASACPLPYRPAVT